MSEIAKWYALTVGSATVNAVAEKSNLVQSTLARQLKADSLSAESVAAIARAYGADVIDALVMLGLITHDDVRSHGVAMALRAALDVEIAAEVMRRMGGDHAVLDAPLS